LANHSRRAFAGPAYVDLDLVFADQLGAPPSPWWLTERFGALRREAGIPTGTLHILRRTHATYLLMSGIPVHVAAARLGDSPTTLMHTYAHLLPTSDSEAAERVAALLPMSVL
jgi:integrase